MPSALPTVRSTRWAHADVTARQPGNYIPGRSVETPAERVADGGYRRGDRSGAAPERATHDP